MHQEIADYWGNSQGEHHRYRSWEHCYGYFQRLGPSGLRQDIDQAALHLGFYLASWGMYRGSSFLLQHAYTVHRDVVQAITNDCFSQLWTADLGSDPSHVELTPLILEFVGAIRKAYRPFAPKSKTAQPTDTLITKVVLGTVGSLPACDRYFIEGFRSDGFKYSYVNAAFIDRIIGFCQTKLDDMLVEQLFIKERSGQHYPLMKLADMYFWQRGVNHEAAVSKTPAPLP